MSVFLNVLYCLVDIRGKGWLLVRNANSLVPPTTEYVKSIGMGSENLHFK